MATTEERIGIEVELLLKSCMDTLQKIGRCHNMVSFLKDNHILYMWLIQYVGNDRDQIKAHKNETWRLLANLAIEIRPDAIVMIDDAYMVATDCSFLEELDNKAEGVIPSEDPSATEALEVIVVRPMIGWSHSMMRYSRDDTGTLTFSTLEPMAEAYSRQVAVIVDAYQNRPKYVESESRTVKRLRQIGHSCFIHTGKRLDSL